MTHSYHWIVEQAVLLGRICRRFSAPLSSLLPCIWISSAVCRGLGHILVLLTGLWKSTNTDTLRTGVAGLPASRRRFREDFGDLAGALRDRHQTQGDVERDRVVLPAHGRLLKKRCDEPGGHQGL